MNGEKLKIERIKRGLTQEALAEKAGITNVSISIIESGKGNPLHITLGKLATALDLPVDFFWEN